MKKKIISIALLITLLFSSLLILTGCGERDDEDKNNTSPTSVVKEAVKAVEEMDYDALMDCIDLKGFYVIYNSSFYYDEDLKGFEEEYDKLSASEWKREKRDAEEKLEEEFEDIKEEMEDYDSLKIKIDNIDYEKIKGTKNIYKIELEVTATLTYDGQTDKESAELDLLVWKNDGEYKIIGADF